MCSKAKLNTDLILAYMREQELTQAEMAKRIGIARTTFRGYLVEPEKVPLHQLSLIADTMGKDVQDIIALEETERRY